MFIYPPLWNRLIVRSWAPMSKLRALAPTLGKTALPLPCFQKPFFFPPFVLYAAKVASPSPSQGGGGGPLEVGTGSFGNSQH